MNSLKSTYITIDLLLDFFGKYRDIENPRWNRSKVEGKLTSTQSYACLYYDFCPLVFDVMQTNILNEH